MYNKKREIIIIAIAIPLFIIFTITYIIGTTLVKHNNIHRANLNFVKILGVEHLTPDDIINTGIEKDDLWMIFLDNKTKVISEEIYKNFKSLKRIKASDSNYWFENSFYGLIEKNTRTLIIPSGWIDERYSGRTIYENLKEIKVYLSCGKYGSCGPNEALKNITEIEKLILDTTFYNSYDCYYKDSLEIDASYIGYLKITEDISKKGSIKIKNKTKINELHISPNYFLYAENNLFYSYYYFPNINTLIIDSYENYEAKNKIKLNGFRDGEINNFILKADIVGFDSYCFDNSCMKNIDLSGIEDSHDITFEVYSLGFRTNSKCLLNSFYFPKKTTELNLNVISGYFDIIGIPDSLKYRQKYESDIFKNVSVKKLCITYCQDIENPKHTLSFIKTLFKNINEIKIVYTTNGICNF